MWETCKRLEEDFNLFWLVEARVLRGRVAAADVYCPEYKLLIQLDGSCHFNKPLLKEGELRKETSQQKRDRKFDDVALKSGFHVLRIHHDDLSYIDTLLFSTLGLCYERMEKPHVFYSPSYPKDMHMVACDDFEVVDLEYVY